MPALRYNTLSTKKAPILYLRYQNTKMTKHLIKVNSADFLRRFFIFIGLLAFLLALLPFYQVFAIPCSQLSQKSPLTETQKKDKIRQLELQITAKGHTLEGAHIVPSEELHTISPFISSRSHSRLKSPWSLSASHLTTFWYKLLPTFHAHDLVVIEVPNAKDIPSAALGFRGLWKDLFDFHQKFIFKSHSDFFEVQDGEQQPANLRAVAIENLKVRNPQSLLIVSFSDSKKFLSKDLDDLMSLSPHLRIRYLEISPTHEAPHSGLNSALVDTLGGEFPTLINASSSQGYSVLQLKNLALQERISRSSRFEKQFPDIHPEQLFPNTQGGIWSHILYRQGSAYPPYEVLKEELSRLDLGIKIGEDYASAYAEGILDERFPKRPHFRIYDDFVDRGGWRDLLETMPYPISFAMDWARRNRITSSTQYGQVHSRLKPSRIPYDPARFYGEEFTAIGGWKGFLNTKSEREIPKESP